MVEPAEITAKETKKGLGWGLWTLIVLAALLLLGMASNAFKDIRPAPRSDSASGFQPIHGIFIRISINEWLKTPGFSQAIADMHLFNAGAFAVEDIEIGCSFHDSSGALVTARRSMVPGILQPGAVIRRDVRFGDQPQGGVTATCAPVGALRRR